MGANRKDLPLTPAKADASIESLITESAFQARVIVCARANGWRIDITDFNEPTNTPLYRFLELVRGHTYLADLLGFVMKKRQSLFSLVYHTFDSRNSAGGFPDLVMVNPNRRQILFVELKAAGNYQSKEQKLWAAGLTCALRDTPNVNYFVWRPEHWPRIVRILGGIDTGLLGKRRK